MAGFIDSNMPNVQKFTSGASLKAGALVTLTSGKLAAFAETGLLGILNQDAEDGDEVLVELYESSRMVNVPYTGTTKTALADTDIGTIFGMSSGKVNLDDTTGGIFVVLGHDAEQKTAKGKILGSACLF